MDARRSSSTQLLLAAAASSLLAACGGLTTPDLAVGEISGRLDGVADPAAAHAYVLGRPETLAPVAADGSYTLRDVPVGDDVQVVFFDGRDRAAVVSAGRVEPARRKAHDQDARALARAARVHVLARGATGARTDGAAFTVEETIFRRESNPGAAVELYPVPAGDWNVRGELKGFRPELVGLSLSEGAEVTLEVEVDEPDDSDGRGCVSTSCSDGLRCDGDDGRCYACASDADCGPGGECEDHACVAAGSFDRDECEPCTADAQCGAGGRCVPSGSGISGYCATAPSSGCDAGFTVKDGRCVPPAWPARSMRDACASLYAAYGSTCLSSATCQQSLAGGACAKPPGAGATTAGTCTAACTKDSDCPKDVGFGLCSAGLCVRGG